MVQFAGVPLPDASKPSFGTTSRVGRAPESERAHTAAMCMPLIKSFIWLGPGVGSSELAHGTSWPPIFR